MSCAVARVCRECVASSVLEHSSHAEVFLQIENMYSLTCPCSLALGTKAWLFETSLFHIGGVSGMAGLSLPLLLPQ